MNIKSIKYWLLAGIICCGFAACNDDDDDPTYSHPQSAEKATAGTYTGTLTRVRVGLANAVEESGEATLVICDSTEHVAVLQFTCESLGISTKRIPVNISYLNAGYQFSNYSTSNVIGSTITGRISSDMEVESAFQLTIRSGRSSPTYDITFTGKKSD